MDGRDTLGRHPLEEDLDELRRETFRWIAATALAGGVATLGAGLIDPTIGTPRIWLAVIAVLGPSVVALRLLDRAYLPAAGLLLGGLVGGVVIAATVYSADQVLFALPLVVFVAPLLVGQSGAGLVAGGTGLLLVVLRPLDVVAVLPGDLLAAVVLLVASFGLSWIAFRPMRITVAWALAGYVEEQRKTEEVRARQAELAKLSKSFAEACDRLEQANLALAQARRAADEARRLKDRFVTAISHELRTPLNLIIGFSEMIANGCAEDGDDEIPSALRQDVETIYHNACHLSSLVDDVLDLGRLDAHRLALQKRWTDLAPIVREAVATVERLYEKAGLSIAVDVPRDLPPLYVDPTRIRQVLINLMTNAVRYIEEGGVRVSVRRNGGEVILSVADSGLGIPTEDLPYVFEPFRQSGQIRQRGGFGLGLTVSKQFVEMHAGAMWVESEPGRGSTFRFTLPMADNVAAVAVSPRLRLLESPHLHGRSGRTVMILDRDDEVGHLFQRYLDNYRVVAATSPEEAAHLAASGTISAIVVSNPDASADDDLVQAALRQLPEAPVLRCVLRTIDRARQELGAAAFLPKPVSREALRKTLIRLKIQPRRALVIDDDPKMLDLLGRMLRALAPGCGVVAATGGEEGLRLARGCPATQPPDLVLLDLLMPGMDGHAFLRSWTADPDLGDVPVVIVSAASEEDHDVITGEAVEIRHRGGMPVAAVMRVLRGALDGLFPRAEADADV